MARLSFVMRIGIASLVLVLHVLVLSYFLLNKPEGVPDYWKAHFIISFTISLCLIFLMYSFQNKKVTVVAFVIRAIIVSVYITSMPQQMNLYTLLLASIIFELFLVTPRLVSISASLFLLLIITGQRCITTQTWDYPQAAPRLSEFIFPWGECLVALIIGLLFRILLDRTMALSQQVEELRKSNIRLVEFNISLQDYTIRAQRENIINERNRISREIHDSVGYILTNLIAILDYTRELVLTGQELALEKLNCCREQARTALEEIRRAVRALRPPVEINYQQAIYSLTKAFSETTGVEVNMLFSKSVEKMDDEYEKHIYRIIQEALTNSFRHGQASKITISLSIKQKQLWVIIEDNGLGIKDFKFGCGLTGIRERIKPLGGVMRIESAPGEGFTIKVYLPLGMKNDAKLLTDII